MLRPVTLLSSAPAPLDQQVGASEATLLAKLGIKPFSYGLVILQVYDNGSLYDPKVGWGACQGWYRKRTVRSAAAMLAAFRRRLSNASGWLSSNSRQLQYPSDTPHVPL